MTVCKIRVMRGRLERRRSPVDSVAETLRKLPKKAVLALPPDLRNALA